MVHGLRQTVYGAKDEGEWAGRPIRIVEDWVCDDLAVNVLEVRTSLKLHQVNMDSLTDIKKEEPDASLFEIPPDYRIEKVP